MKTQHVVQGVVYRWQGTELEFLVVKRVPEDGGFWQAITGTMEDGEDMVQTLRREIMEEAGISQTLHISDCLETFVWHNEAKGVEGEDSVFAVEVASDVHVTLDANEHTEFKWLALTDATDLLKYDGNKRSMERVAAYAQNRRQL